MLGITSSGNIIRKLIRNKLNEKSEKPILIKSMPHHDALVELYFVPTLS